MMSANYLQWCMYKRCHLLIIERYGRQICRVVDIFSSSAKLGIYVPKFHWRFNYILHVAKSILFLWLGFSTCTKCPSCSIWTILYPGLPLRSHLLGCLFLKYTLSPILKEGGVLSMVFCAVLGQFPSNVFLAMANAQCMCFRIQHSRIWISQESLHGL